MKVFFDINSLSTIWLALGILVITGILLSLGRRLKSAMKLERFGIPIALLVGIIGIILGPFGPIPVLPAEVMDIWVHLPTALLTLVFATLMIGRPIPKNNGLWQPVSAQVLLGLLLGFGQYVVGGLIVLFLLTPYLGVDPLMGCLIEIGFEGGHGAAAIMGESFEKLGYPEGFDFGLAMATVGLLSSTLIGSALVVLGRIKGWVPQDEIDNDLKAEETEGNGSFPARLRSLLINLALAGSAVGFGWTMLCLLRLFAPYMGEIMKEVILGFPVFPLALLGSLLIRYLLEITGRAEVVSSLLQREIGILSTDLLIITAMAGLNLPLLLTDWKPFMILAVGGLTWNLFGMFLFSRLLFSNNWFERSITEFGNATGVAASGLLLLRLADPGDLTNTLPIFSIKQLFLQPLLSGGLITVIAPFFIINFGLVGWTQLCSLVTIILFFIAILFPVNSLINSEQ